MIDSVAGAMARPMPVATTRLATSRNPYVVERLDVEAMARPPASRTSPPDTTTLVPHRAASLAARGDTMPMVTRKGQSPHTCLERVVAEHELQLLGEEEQPTKQGQEDHGDGDAGGGEAGIAKDAQVDHRVGAAELPADPAGQHGDAAQRPARWFGHSANRRWVPR